MEETTDGFFLMFDPCLAYSQLVYKTLADCVRTLKSLLQVEQAGDRSSNLGAGSFFSELE